MRTQYDFLIGEISMRVIGAAASPVDVGLKGFRPFATQLESDPKLTIDAEVELPTDWWSADGIVGRTLIDRFDFEERDCDCVLARDEEARWFGLFPREEGCRPIVLRHKFGSSLIECNAGLDGAPDASLWRFGLWIAFGLIAVPNGAISS